MNSQLKMNGELKRFNFNIKGAVIFPAIYWQKFPVFKFAHFLKKIFFILSFLFLLVFLYGFAIGNFPQFANKKLLGFFLFFLFFWLFFKYLEFFFNEKLKKPKLKTNLKEALALPDKYNLADFLNFETGKAVYQSIKFVISRELPIINSDILFYFILNESLKINFIFNRLLLNPKEIKNFLRDYLFKLPPEKTVEKRKEFTIDFQKTIILAMEIAKNKDKERVEEIDILTALSKENDFFQKILIKSNLKSEDIENLAYWIEYLEKRISQRKKFWQYENLMQMGTLAKEWTAGYTITLDKYAIDLTEKIKRNFPEIIGHETEIKSLERILSRREINNALLVGEPGTGRKSIVYNLAKRSLSGQSLPEVNYKRVIQLDLPSLLAELPNSEEVEIALDKIFQEVVFAGNVILVIDEFHNYIGQVAKPGIIDISGVLTSYLHLPQFQIVAITTYEGLHKNIEQNPSVIGLFEKVEVGEVSKKETLILLENLTFALEKKYKIFISYPAIREIIDLTEKYMPAIPFPEKAMDVLDEVAIYVAQNVKEKIVLPRHVATIVKEKTQIPVGEIETKEKEILLNLEDLIHQRIINQEIAVKEIATALQRARAQISIRKGPMGGFLFLGPTGVGKTETAKALAEIYFGGENKMIRLDMSEFQAIEDIPRLLGAPGQEGLLTTPVRENPFSLLLLDEFEKAHPNILNLFLQVLDEGHLTDGQGRKVDFKNTIIIATSNAGYQIILEALKENLEWQEVKEKLLDFIFQEGIFRPELINRFDGVIVFKPLSKEDLLNIAELLLQKLKKNLSDKGIEFLITPGLKEKIVELSYDPKFGAREMRRAIQDKVENVLAKAMLSGKIKRGGLIKIDPNNFELKL